MKITPAPNLTFPLPLPIYNSIPVGEAVSRDGEHFSIFIGLDEKMVEKLKALSSDESDTELQENTSDQKRFALGSYADWYEKSRTPFALIHTETSSLAALVWLGPKPLEKMPGDWHTVGWRSYPDFRGKGLMKTFAQFAMDVYQKNVPGIKIWIVTKKGNTGSAKLATSLGFQVLEEASDKKSLIMVK